MNMETGAGLRPLVVGIGGAVYPGSGTERALRYCLDQISELGGETRLYSASELDLPMYGSTKPRPDAADVYIRDLRRSAAVVVATPSYHGSVSGFVKNALDYVEDMSRDDQAYLEGRPVGLIVTAAGHQALGTTLSSLRSVVHALRGWPTPFGAAICTPSDETAIRAQTQIVANHIVEQLTLRRHLAPAAFPEMAN